MNEDESYDALARLVEPTYTAPTPPEADDLLAAWDEEEEEWDA